MTIAAAQLGISSSVQAQGGNAPSAHRTLQGGIGHTLPQEAPQEFADAVLEVARYV